jgi:hypothetical protein
VLVRRLLGLLLYVDIRSVAKGDRGLAVLELVGYEATSWCVFPSANTSRSRRPSVVAF